MRTGEFLLPVVPLMVLVNAAFFAGVFALPLDHSVPNATHISKAVVFSLALVVITEILEMFKFMFRIADSSVFASHIQPCLKELVKMAFISFIAYHDKGPARLAVMQFFIISGVFSLVVLGRFLSDFTPALYARKYSVFLGLYDDFHRKESYDDESRNDATVQMFDSLRRHSQVDAEQTLADKLPKQISIPQLAPSELNKCLKTQISAPVMRNTSSVSSLACTSKTLGRYKSCYNMIDKLYSVSPKNTYHLNIATASAVTMMELESDDEIDDEDAVSVHTTDTHLGAGAGGYFKHKYPGGKLQLGGGGGIGYDHSESRRLSSSGPSTSETTSNSWWFISWLIPIEHKRKTHGVKHKLSVYNLKRSLTGDTCEESPLLIDLDPKQPFYQSTDPEVKYQLPLKLTKQEFLNYVTIYLGLDWFRITLDPLYEKYGSSLIQDLNCIEAFSIYLADLNWELGTLLVYSLNYLTTKPIFLHYFWILLVVKLFNVNVLNKLKIRLWIIMGLKSVTNAIIFCIIVVLYIM